MAKIIEEAIVIKFSKLVKNNESSTILTKDQVKTLEEAVGGLIDDESVIIEAELVTND